MNKPALDYMEMTLKLKLKLNFLLKKMIIMMERKMVYKLDSSTFVFPKVELLLATCIYTYIHTYIHSCYSG